MEQNNEQKAKKYLIYSIGSDYYGIGIEKVREIIRFHSITGIHDTQEYIRGVINLRGKIIPVMDLRLKLALPFQEYTDKTVLIILDIEGEKGQYQMALAVDAVHEVISPQAEELEDTPSLGLKMKRDYLSGIIGTDDRMIMIMDINRVVNSQEILAIQEKVSQ